MYRWLVLLLESGTGLSLALLLAGIAAGVVTGTPFSPTGAGVPEIISGLILFEPSAIMALGLLLLLATPVLSVIMVAAFSLVRKDRLGSVTSLVVLVVLAISLALAFRG